MGVSGSGKTTVGKLVAERLGLAFHDADDFHSAANIAKMESGTPLTDADRQPWLEAMAAEVPKWQATGGAVLACSALRETYRQTIQSQASQPVRWVFLDGPVEVLRKRMENRKNHYMHVSMLESQLATLEKPAYGLCVSIELAAEEATNQIVRRLHDTAASV